MGNYRFRLSNIIPNSWFHSSIAGKRSKNRSIKTQPVTTSSSSSSLSSFPAIQQADDKRKSYYFTRELTVPNDESSPSNPQKNSSSEKQRPIRRKREQRVCKAKSKSISKSNSSDSEGKSVSTNSIYEDHVYGKVDLAPIITKPTKKNELGSGKWAIDGGRRSLSLKVVKDGGVVGSPMRKGRGTGSGYSPRVGVGNRVRIQGINGGRRSHGYRRSLSESMAVVKTSVDPGRDFKESMVEMIRENKMKSCEDLEELLACYLSLNSDEYHDLIIKVFKQIWFESTNIRL